MYASRHLPAGCEMNVESGKSAGVADLGDELVDCAA
jgi:hypothetical protein